MLARAKKNTIPSVGKKYDSNKGCRYRTVAFSGILVTKRYLYLIPIKTRIYTDMHVIQFSMPIQPYEEILGIGVLSLEK